MTPRDAFGYPFLWRGCTGALTALLFRWKRQPRLQGEYTLYLKTKSTPFGPGAGMPIFGIFAKVFGNATTTPMACPQPPSNASVRQPTGLFWLGPGTPDYFRVGVQGSSICAAAPGWPVIVCGRCSWIGTELCGRGLARAA